VSIFDPDVFPVWLAFASGLMFVAGLAWAAVDEWAGRAWRGLTVTLAVLVTWLIAWCYVAIDAQDNPGKYKRPAEAEPAR